MERLRYSDLSTLLEVVGEIGEADDLDEFAELTMRAAARLVDCDLVGYTEVDPSGDRNLSRAEPDVGTSEQLLRSFMEHTHQHPLINYCARTGDCSAHTFSDFLSLREFCRLELYADYFRHVDIRHQIAIALPMPAPNLLGVTLNRARHDFSDHDRIVLDTLRPHLVNVRRGVLAQAKALTLLEAIAEVASDTDPALLILDHAGTIQQMTGTARRLLRAYFPGSDRPDELPDELAIWRHRQAVAAEPLLVHREGGTLTVELATSGRGPAQTQIVVLREQRSAPSPEAMSALGLTAREGEVLTLVCRGATNDQIAATLVISARTVQKHLEHILAKLDVPTRTAAAARALTAL